APRSAASGVPPEVPALRSGPRSAHLGGVVRVVVDQDGARADVACDEQDAAEDEGDRAPLAGGAEQLVAGAGVLAVHDVLRLGSPTSGVECSGGGRAGLCGGPRGWPVWEGRSIAPEATRPVSPVAPDATPHFPGVLPVLRPVLGAGKTRAARGR